MPARKPPPDRRPVDRHHDGEVPPVEGGVPGPQSPKAARQWGATYGRGPESGTDYEASRQSTPRIRASHRLAQGPGNPRLQGAKVPDKPKGNSAEPGR